MAFEIIIPLWKLYSKEPKQYEKPYEKLVSFTDPPSQQSQFFSMFFLCLFIFYNYFVNLENENTTFFHAIIHSSLHSSVVRRDIKIQHYKLNNDIFC